MLKASLKGNFEIDKTIGGASLSFDAAGYFKLRATVNDATVVPCPSFKGFTLSVEKPNLFIIDFNILEKDVDRFQLMNTRKIAEKTLKLTFVAEETNSIVDGSFVIDPRNKLSLNYMLATNNCKLKYTYGHEGIATFEPCYDLVKHVWDFSVLRKICDTDTLKTTYQCSSKMLGFEWSWNPKSAGSFKVCASMNLAEKLKMPKVITETTWNFDI